MVKRFKTELYNCVGFIQDPKKLKESVKQLYQKYVQDDTVCKIILLKSCIVRVYIYCFHSLSSPCFDTFLLNLSGCFTAIHKMLSCVWTRLN